MCDPYCPLVVPVTLPQAAYDSAPLIPPEGSVRGEVLLGCLGGFLEDFDWKGVTRPQRAVEEMVVMEVDVEAAGGGEGLGGTWLRVLLFTFSLGSEWIQAVGRGLSGWEGG